MNIIQRLLQESEGYLTDKAEILKDLERFGIISCTIVDGRVNLEKDDYHKVDTIEFCSQFKPAHGKDPVTVKFGDVDGHIVASHCQFTNFDWLPKRIEGELEICETNVKISDIDVEWCDTINLRNCDLTTVKDIHKHIKRARVINLRENTDIKNGILDLLKVEDLQSVTGYLGKVTNQDGVYHVANVAITPSEAALTVVNRRLKLAAVNKKKFTNADIMAIQEELLDLDLEDYA